ncbi:hypothetical protein [Quadrisphaera sp. KR29]|uniref:hypothetical protein n=1 Tax=Quadrisphaera sp. KR29 TaxID=3461391 RepID=UPI004044E924
MAGGMAKKGAPLPAWLVAANAEARLAAEESLKQRRPPGNPFVWVVATEADYPGIVIDRRRVEAGWQILVVYATPGLVMVQQWLDAEQLLPLDLDRQAASTS